MDILQATRQLRPGTAWNYIGGQLFQAIDGTERVSIPAKEELRPFVDVDFDLDKVSNL